MNFYLLDMGGAGLYNAALLILIVFILFAVLIEAFVMKLMNYNPFGKAFLHSAIVNLVSLAAGFILVTSFEGQFDIYTTDGFFEMFGLTILLEGVVLYFLNNTRSFWKTLLVSLVMNVVSYVLLLLFIVLSS